MFSPPPLNKRFLYTSVLFFFFPSKANKHCMHKNSTTTTTQQRHSRWLCRFLGFSLTHQRTKMDQSSAPITGQTVKTFQVFYLSQTALFFSGNGKKLYFSYVTFFFFYFSHVTLRNNSNNKPKKDFFVLVLLLFFSSRFVLFSSRKEKEKITLEHLDILTVSSSRSRGRCCPTHHGMDRRILSVEKEYFKKYYCSQSR